jgi:copper(I)-binding protein
MKRFSILACLLFAAAAAHAQVTVSDAWVRAAVSGQQATGAFMRIQATQDVRLVAVASPVAGVAEIHEMKVEGGVMKMRPVEGGLPIAKGNTAQLVPGGYHVMLMALKQAVTEGQTVPITLTFDNLTDKQQFTRQIDAPVRALNAAQPAPMQH